MKTALVAVVAVLAIIGIVVGVLAARGHSTASSGSAGTGTSPSSTPSGLQITDVKVGDGAVAQAGDTVSVTYTGTLTNGTVFDSSDQHGGQPFSFTLGAGQVIQGWDKGLLGMKVGGERKLVIPPDLGYGSQAVGSIPPDSTLMFDVKLLSVTPGSAPSPSPAQ